VVVHNTPKNNQVEIISGRLGGGGAAVAHKGPEEGGQCTQGQHGGAPQETVSEVGVIGQPQIVRCHCLPSPCLSAIILRRCTLAAAASHHDSHCMLDMHRSCSPQQLTCLTH
jgi:hypothetical protein